MRPSILSLFVVASLSSLVGCAIPTADAAGSDPGAGASTTDGPRLAFVGLPTPSRPSIPGTPSASGGGVHCKIDAPSANVILSKPHQNGAGGLSVRETHAAWFTIEQADAAGPGVPASIMSASSAGVGPIAIGPHVRHLATSNEGVWWAMSPGGLAHYDLQTERLHVYVTSGAASGVVATDDRVWWTELGDAPDGSDARLQEVEVATSTVRMMAIGGFTGAMALDDDAIVALTNLHPYGEDARGTLDRISLADRTVQTLVEYSAAWPRMLKTHASGAVYVLHHTSLPELEAIYVTSTHDASGEVSPLWYAPPGHTITDVAIDGSYVYWIDGSEILRLRRDGSMKLPQTIAHGTCAPRTLTVDDASVYFITVQPTADRLGSVWSLPKSALSK